MASWSGWWNCAASASRTATSWRPISEGGTYESVSDAGQAYVNSGSTWEYYKSVFGRDSFDGAGAKLVSTVHYGSEYQNAYWDGLQMVYGDGMTTWTSPAARSPTR